MTFVRVDEWNPKEEDKIVSLDGSLFNVDLEKAFDNRFDEPIPENAGVFIIMKKSYKTTMIGRHDKDKNEEDRFDGGIHYINYFMKYYDPEKQLPIAYLFLKGVIENSENFPTEKEMEKIIYDNMFSPKIVNAIHQMAADNWYIEPEKKKNKDKYNDQLVFTKEHSIRMMCISIGIKFMIPVVMHYLHRHTYTQDMISKYYMRLFDIFSGDIDLYNKLWITVRSRVQRSMTRGDRGSWDKQQVDGYEPEAKIDELVSELLIREIVPRYVFKKNWIHFNSVVIEDQIRNFAKNNYGVTIVEVDNVKSPEGLSEVDKLEMNNYKMDESLPVLSSLNTQQLIKYLMSDVTSIADFEQEVGYYIDNHKMSKVQSALVFYHYVDMFSGYRDLHTINRDQYMRLMVLLKRKLESLGFETLPQIISGNLVEHSKRTIKNQKFLRKIGTSSMYRDLMSNKFNSLNELGKDEYILGELSVLLRSKFTFVDFRNPELLGEDIKIVEDELSSEYLSFLMLT